MVIVILPVPQSVRKNLTGKFFGEIEVIGFGGYLNNGDYRKRMVWVCRCKHGKVYPVDARYLARTKTCRCVISIHGMSETPIYKIWKTMKTRCSNKKFRFYYRHGGRGIGVCERWKRFENFYADMGPRPSKDHSLDRINNDGNYEPGNVRWATRKQQAANCRPRSA